MKNKKEKTYILEILIPLLEEQIEKCNLICSLMKIKFIKISIHP